MIQLILAILFLSSAMAWGMDTIGKKVVHYTPKYKGVDRHVLSREDYLNDKEVLIAVAKPKKPDHIYFYQEKNVEEVAKIETKDIELSTQLCDDNGCGDWHKQ